MKDTVDREWLTLAGRRSNSETPEEQFLRDWTRDKDSAYRTGDCSI